MGLREEIIAIESRIQGELVSAGSSHEIEQLKIKYLGKKGLIQGLMVHLKNASQEERPLLGQEINRLKQTVTSSFEERLALLEKQELSQRLQKESLDASLPGSTQPVGQSHPVQQVMERAVDILKSMGFSVAYGPDVETDFYNFEALNFPPDHPAREMQDTFYLSTDLLLRTHTSNVQVRLMEKSQLPIRMIAPGRCFRNETISARSHIFFHQIEGFYIDEAVSFSDLMATMELFWSRFFGQSIKTRFRPSYFPFVEPGMEIDIHCTSCKGQGCRICKHTGWLEVAGAGLIHPEVLKSGGIDPDQYSGYAWGMGIERLAMLELGVKDIRTFTENDMRFLSQFP